MTDSDPWIGRQVGNYRIVEIINSGTFGSVYKGKHLYFEHDPVVAIKLPCATFHTQEECKEFIREVQLQRQLRHPHILPILDAGFQNGISYLVMIYATGGSLRTRLGKRNGQPLPLDEALMILTQVGQALHYAHQYQPSVVHRDLKPENILFDEQENVLLADFGITVLLSSIHTGLVGSGGTPPYMAPEQFEGLASPKSDQYALGCIAYELLTGRKVFSLPNPSLEAWWYHYAKIEPVPPRHYNSHLPTHIEQAILTAISKDRANRHRDIAAFIQAVTETNERPAGGDILSDAGHASTTTTKLLIGTTLLTYRGHRGGALAVSWSPDGRRIASAGLFDRVIQVWDVVNGQVLMTYNGHEGAVEAVNWSPDGRRIASAGTVDGMVQVWDAATGQVLATYRGHAHFIRVIAWSPDGKHIASCTQDKMVQVWDAATGQVMMTYRGHTDSVRAVGWSPDGKRIASSAGDKTMHVWDVATGQVVTTYRGYSPEVEALAWSPDGRRIASFAAERKTVQVWDAATGQDLMTFQGHTGWVEAIAWSPDGRYIASSARDKTVQVWDAATTGLSDQALMIYRGHAAAMVKAISWSPDGRGIVSADVKDVQVWDVMRGQTLRIYQGHAALVEVVRWSPDGRRIASGVGDVQVWDAATGQLLLAYRGHTGWVKTLAWSPDGRSIASCSMWDGSSDSAEDKAVQVWDAATGQKLMTYRGHSDWVYGLAWSPDGRTIASGSDDGTVQVWDAVRGKTLGTYRGEDIYYVHTLAWSPDGKRIASSSGGEGTVYVWDAAKGRILMTYRGHGNSVEALAWSPDGRTIASGSDDGTVQVWDATQGRPLGAYQGYTPGVDALAWSSDGRRIAFAGSQGVQVWNAATGQLLMSYRGYTSTVKTLAWSPDGRAIASGSLEVTIWQAE